MLRITVRVAIHSSDVSTIFERSLFEMLSDGTADPHPMNFEPRPTTLQFLMNVKTFPATVKLYFIYKANNCRSLRQPQLDEHKQYHSVNAYTVSYKSSTICQRIYEQAGQIPIHGHRSHELASAQLYV